MDATGIDALEVTRAGLREGVLFESHLLAGGTPRPTTCGPARCATSPRSIASISPMPVTSRGWRCRCTTRSSPSSSRKPAPGERELLATASLLHGAGASVSAARDALLDADLHGHSPREVALIAQIIRYHRKGTPPSTSSRRSAAAATSISSRGARSSSGSPPASRRPATAP